MHTSMKCQVFISPLGALASVQQTYLQNGRDPICILDLKSVMIREFLHVIRSGCAGMKSVDGGGKKCVGGSGCGKY